jgi:hypothetical protein
MMTTILRLPAKGDEPGVYLPVILASIEAWPSLNLATVSYGISPLWTWLTGLLGQVFSPLVAGRLVSMMSWLGALFLYLRARRGTQDIKNCDGLSLEVVILFAMPVSFVFAMRCHPFWLGVLLLLSAFQFLRISVGGFAIALAAAVSAQTFLVFAGMVGFARSIAELLTMKAVVLLACVAVAVGIVGGWLLYGGRYPTDFKASEYYAPYLSFDGFTEGYIPLQLGLFGWTSLIFIRAKVQTTIVPISLLFLLPVTMFALFSLEPVGPIFTAFGKFGVPGIWAGKALIVAGTYWIFRHGWQFAGIAVISALALATLPFFYERYAWFVIIAMFMVRLSTDSDTRLRTFPTWLAWGGGFIAVGTAWAFSFIGSL